MNLQVSSYTILPSASAQILQSPSSIPGLATAIQPCNNVIIQNVGSGDIIVWPTNGTPNTGYYLPGWSGSASIPISSLKIPYSGPLSATNQSGANNASVRVLMF